jgi:predicted nucleotidyltransferase
MGLNRAEVIHQLKSIEPMLRAHGVAALYLFGSYARGEARPGSDLDVFVDKAPGPFGFDELMGSYHALRDALPGIEINFGTRQGLSKYVKDEVEQEALRIF